MTADAPPAPVADGRPALAARLEEPATAAALHRLLDRLDRLEAAAGTVETLLGQAPGWAALMVDIADEAYEDAARAGFDLDLSVRQGAAAALRVAESLDAERTAGVVALIESGLLNRGAVEALGRVGHALARCGDEGQARTARAAMGPVDVLRALRDPDTRRALAFVFDVLRHFGRTLEERPAGSGAPWAG